MDKPKSSAKIHDDNQSVSTRPQEQENVGELSSLSELYGLLERDAKFLVQDLHSGVFLYKFVIYLLGLIAASGIAFVILTLSYPSAQITITHGMTFWALALSVISCLGAVLFAREYLMLKRKYTQLFKTAKEKLH
ncbi:MAG: hypothetical protein M1368_07045 [Thaumarchaeota archaeon]|nr:hypothetical protein [Nitrososphaerota archaeon]